MTGYLEDGGTSRGPSVKYVNLHAKECLGGLLKSLIGVQGVWDGDLRKYPREGGGLVLKKTRLRISGWTIFEIRGGREILH